MSKVAYLTCMKCSFVLLLAFALGACSRPMDPKLQFDKGNYAEAYQLWLVQAEQGDAEAKNYIGILYYMGLGTTRDYDKARFWFEQAASDGVADAQYNLGAMYENGEFYDIDYMKAYMWLFAAHKNGNTHAASRMWGITGDHKLFGNQVALAEKMAEPYISRKTTQQTTRPNE